MAASLKRRFLESITNLFMFHPTRGQHTQPSQLGMDFSELRIVAEDGVRTQAWWLPSAVDGAFSGCTVVTFHGNGGTMADRLDWLQLIVAEGASVLATEYRGYGDSEGTPSEQACRLDARAALGEARRLAGEAGGPLLLHGRSLGGAVAIALAAEESIDGLIAESTFTRVREMASRTGIPFAARLVAYEFDSLSCLQKVTAPVFLVHGTSDTLIPFSMGEALRDALRERDVPVTFLAVPGGEHNSTWQSAGERYWEELRRWRQETVRPA